MLTPDDRAAYQALQKQPNPPKSPLEEFQATYAVYRRLYLHVPTALVAAGWPPADDPEHRIATTLTMLYLDGPYDPDQHLTAIHAALLANGNAPDIDTLVNLVQSTPLPIIYTKGHPDPERNHELRLLLRANDSQIRTDALLKTIYYLHEDLSQGHPLHDTKTSNNLLHATTRILNTITTTLFLTLDNKP